MTPRQRHNSVEISTARSAETVQKKLSNIRSLVRSDVWHNDTTIPDFDIANTTISCLAAGVLLSTTLPLCTPVATRLSSTRSELLSFSLTTTLILAILPYTYIGLSDLNPISSQADVVGLQWYWVLTDVDCSTSTALKAGEVWALSTSALLSLPCSGLNSILATGADVIHSLAYPTLRSRTDTTPGRLSLTQVVDPSQGCYYGQCSELCGALHGFMSTSLLSFTSICVLNYLMT